MFYSCYPCQTYIFSQTADRLQCRSVSPSHTEKVLHIPDSLCHHCNLHQCIGIGIAFRQYFVSVYPLPGKSPFEEQPHHRFPDSRYRKFRLSPHHSARRPETERSLRNRTMRTAAVHDHRIYSPALQTPVPPSYEHRIPVSRFSEIRFAKRCSGYPNSQIHP